MNIRTLARVSAALAVVSGIVAAMLWKELHAARAVTAALRVERGGRAEVPVAPMVAAAPARPDAAAPAGTRASGLDAPVPSAAATARTMGRDNLGEPDLQDLLKDPEYRKARAIMMRSSMVRSYPGLAEELGLTQEEADQLFGLLAESQMASMADPSVARAGQSPDPAVVAQQRQIRAERQDQETQAIRNLLGEVRFQQWREYQGTRAPRQQVDGFSTTLARAGLPLDAAQNRNLVAVAIAERNRVQQETREQARPINPRDPGTEEQTREAARVRQAQRDQRLLEAMSPHLSPQQREVLRSQMDRQAEARQAF